MGNSLAKQARAAAACNDVPRLTQIVSSGAGQDALMKASFFKARTALHYAARAGCAEALAAVIEVASHHQGTGLVHFLNLPDYHGDTALALACKHGHASCLRELLEAGASPLPANSHGFTALHHAAVRGHADCLRLILSSHIRLSDGIRGRTADALVPDVIDMDRYLDTRTHAGLCALHLAVLSGNQSAVNELVTAGAQLDTPLLAAGLRAPLLMPACLSAGSTALHMAAATGRPSLVITLLHAQQQRHPGLELRRMRNARGMTPLNVALLCGFSNMASLLAAGAPLPAAPPSSRPRQLPPLLRQQLLALVHRANLLSQLRQLGLGPSATGQAQRLPPGPVARLQTLLSTDSATPSQVLAAVDELLEEAAAASAGAASGADGEAAAQAGAGVVPGLPTAPLAGWGEQRRARGGRRRRRRREEQEQQVQRQLAAAQSGADWTFLERTRSLWHAEHSSSLYRRLHRRHDRHAPVQQPLPQAAAAGAPPLTSQEEALLLANTLLGGGDLALTQRAQQRAQQQAQQPLVLQPSPSLDTGCSSGSSSGGSGESSSDAEGTKPGKPAAAAAAAGSDGEAAVCPVCLDLAADVSVSPCGHRACMVCCGRLASYSSTSNSFFGLPLQSPLCPLCRGPIEGFRHAAAAS